MTEMEVRNTITKEKRAPRGGVGSKGDPVEIKRSILEATKDIHRANRDLGKIVQDKEELLRDLANLQSYTAPSGEHAPRSSHKMILEKSIRALQKKLGDISGFLPEFNLSDAQKKIQKIITEWKEEKKELRSAALAHMKAERALAKNPAEQRVLGDANRAEAAIYDTMQRMDTTVQEALLASEAMVPSPVTDEAVNIHTGGEEVKSEKSKVKSDGEREAPLAPDVAQEEGIHYTHEQALADEKVRDALRRVSADTIITSALLEAEQELGIITSETVAPETPSSPPAEAETKQHAEQQEEKNETLVPGSISLAEPELPAPEEHLLLEEGELEVPIVPKTLAPAERMTEPQAKEQEETKEVSADAPVLPAVNKVLRDHLNELFGAKGFLGLGAKEGIESPHWADSVVGFANKTIEDIRTARSFVPSQERQACGIENERETFKMRGYLDQANEQTGVAPMPMENVRAYLVRAIARATDRDYTTNE